MTAAKLADTSDPRFTDDQRATLARFEATPTPPEVVEARVVEEVARAIHGEDCLTNCGEVSDQYRRLATAAVAAYRAAQDGWAEEAHVMCTHDGQDAHQWEPGETCPDALPAGTWSVR